MGYLSNFIVYTLAMVGIIAITLLVFKGSNPCAVKGKTKMLKVLDTLSIAPRKTLYVVSAGSEKFLVAGDVGRTTLISKLENNKIDITNIASSISEKADSTNDLMNSIAVSGYSNKSFKDTMNSIPKSKYTDNTQIGINSSLLSKKTQDTAYTSVIKNLAMKMKN